MSTEVMRMRRISFEMADASTMLKDALASCTRRLGAKSASDVVQAIQRAECSLCESVRHELAQEVAAYLGSVDPGVKAIYTYEPEYATSVDEPLAERPNMSPGINLLVWVNRKSAALSSVVSMLGEGIDRESKRLGCSKGTRLCWTLDVQVVDDDDVETRTGYGALVQSLYVRPVEIWRRQV